MIEEIFTDLAPLSDKLGVTLTAEGDGIMTGSDALIYRLIFNLTENAVKYNRPGGSVRVSVTQELEKLLLRVSDTGCGIPEEYQRSIFQPFFRVDKSRSANTGGRGGGGWGCGRAPPPLGGPCGGGGVGGGAPLLGGTSGKGRSEEEVPDRAGLLYPPKSARRGLYGSPAGWYTPGETFYGSEEQAHSLEAKSFNQGASIMKYQTVLFDMDGTLLDTPDGHGGGGEPHPDAVCGYPVRPWRRSGGSWATARGC